MTPTVTVRELPFDEWHRLEGHPELPNGLPPQSISTVVVAEQGDKIVGFWFAMQAVHLEPVWVHEDHRGSSWGIRMWHEMHRILDDCQVPAAFCTAPLGREDVTGYLERLGFELLPQLTFFYRNPSWIKSKAPDQDSRLGPHSVAQSAVPSVEDSAS